MRAVIQRVSGASVSIDGDVVGEIERGLLIYLGVDKGDDRAKATKMATKIANMRLFPDENGIPHFSLIEKKYGALVISQFTLCADTSKGNRPSYFDAMPPNEAQELFTFFLDELEKIVVRVATGRFGAHMHVTSINDGPITIPLIL